MLERVVRLMEQDALNAVVADTYAFEDTDGHTKRYLLAALSGNSW